MCFCRYFIPWLEASLGIARSPEYAVLQRDVYFDPPVQYFQQVELSCRENGQWQANPVEGNGSGDFSQLTSTDRSEEHTSELQSLMRISYAVFCLKKKKKNKNKQQQHLIN